MTRPRMSGSVDSWMVLFAVVEAGGVGDVAALLGLSQATVKTHLRQVFAKTGVARQAELVRLVAGFLSPAGRPQ